MNSKQCPKMALGDSHAKDNNEKETAKLFFQHCVISQYGIPRQVICMYQTGTLDGEESFGRRFVIKWE